jgi:hypothetical protein
MLINSLPINSVSINSVKGSRMRIDRMPAAAPAAPSRRPIP